MATLGDDQIIKANIKNGRAKNLKILSRILFGNEQRLNRKMIDRFGGFPFTEKDEEFEMKVQEIKAGFKIVDLVTPATF